MMHISSKFCKQYMQKAKTFGDGGAISVPSTIHIEGTRAAFPRTLKTPGSDLTRQEESLDARPIFGSDPTYQKTRSD